jgi:lactate dehydrogenase-like 2-hydroxyacid dehydrogenase
MGPAFDVCLTEYRKSYDVHVIEDTHKPTDEDRAVAAGVEAVVSYAAQRPHDLGLFPRLKFISSFGAGYDKIDLQTAANRGIVITNTPGATDGSVADMAFTLMLATARRLLVGDAYVRSGDWQTKGMFPLTRSVNGRRIGIVGLGRIGSAIARRAAGFDMQISYHNRRPVADCRYTYFDTPEALAANCDFLVISASGGPASRHLVSEKVIRALGPDGTVINVSRGSVVDEKALVRALQDGAIAAAGLDVFEEEPLGDSPLKSMPNVTLMPHRGSATCETFQGMAQMVVANLDTFFSGRPPLYAIPMPEPRLASANTD